MSARRSFAPHVRVGFATSLAALAIVGIGALSNACSSIDPLKVEDDLYLPDRNEFKTQGVSLLLETRCGSLDCHGQTSRPLRIYSTNGLRFANADGGTRDLSPTTDKELTENYFSVIGLEPEDVSAARATAGDFQDFLLLKKPLGMDGDGVRHKGGQIFRTRADPGYQCLLTWMAKQVDPAKCAEALTP